MGTELNFTARLDTSQFMSQIDQARTQFSLAFGPMGMGGGYGGLAGAAQSQFQQMMSGLPSTPMMGSTFTNPAIAYSPFYGQVQATSQLDQEWAVHRYGLELADRMRPPGVSGADYFLGMEKNFINRQLEATHAANTAARSTLASGVGGMLGGEAASMIATPLGAMAGGAIASRLLGAGAAGAGAMLGGLAAGWYAYDAGMDFVGGKINNYYAQAEQIGGITAEMGEIVGAGRNLRRGDRYELGMAARQAAGDLKMDVQNMGDILSLGRDAGMLPNGSDPGKAREQYREFARAVDEGAQILGTSLSGATQVIKMATSSGMTAQEGIIRAAGMGVENFGAMMAFGQQGASVGRGMGFTGAQGSGIFMGALSGIDNAGLSHEEMQIMGGRFGAAQFVGQTQMAMAKSPMGNVQLMASMGGGGMGGMGMMDLPGAALSGLMSGGGDFMSNMVNFQVHQNEMRRGIGASGIRTMARSQLAMGGEMIQMFAPGVDDSTAQRMYAQSMGMDADQAKTLVGGVRGGGVGMGGMGANARVQAIIAMQSSQLGHMDGGEAPSGSSAGMIGAGIGGLIGSIALPGIGTAIGAGLGYLGGKLGSALLDDGPPIWDFSAGRARHGFMRDPQERADYDQRHMAAEYEERLDAAKARIGYLDIDPGAGRRFMNSNLSGARLNLDAAGSPIASMRTGAMMSALGIGPSAAGAGTIQVNGTYRSAGAMQAMASKLWSSPIGQKDLDATLGVASSAAFGSGIDRHAVENDINSFVKDYEAIRTGEGMDVGDMWNFRDRGADTLARARRLISGAGGDASVMKKRGDLLGKLNTAGGLMDPEVRAALQQITGHNMESLAGGFMAGRGGAAAMRAAEQMTLDREGNFLQMAYKGKGGGTQFVTTGDPYADLRQMHDMGSTHANNNPLPASYYKDLQQNRHYLEAKEASLHGHMDEARKDLQAATTEVRNAGGDRYRNIDAPSIDPTRAIAKPGAIAIAGTMLAAARAIRVTEGAGSVAAVKLEADATAMAGQTTTWAREVAKEHKEAMDGARKDKLRAMRPPTFERSIGFGEHESAMSSINRSLKSTERALNAMEKKLAGMGATPSAGTTTAGAKP